jgi:hypothetical protein
LTLKEKSAGATASWVCNGVNGGGNSGSCVATRNALLSVSVSGGGTVTGSNGINCTATGGTCSADFAPGTDVTLSETSDVNNNFSGWGGACSGTGGCSVTMNSNQSVSASFGVVPQGTVKVVSQNAIYGSIPVPAAWAFLVTDFINPSNPTNPCPSPTTPGCYNTANASYPNLDQGSYDLYPSSGSAGPQYAIKSIERVPLARNTSSWWSNLVNGIVHIANAWTFAPGISGSQSILSPSLTASYIILWSPIAHLNITSPNPSLTDTAPNGSITIQNDGAPGSQLDWIAVTPATYSVNSGGKQWLSYPTDGSVSNGATQSGASGATQNIIVTANPSGLAPGTTYTATLTLKGTDHVHPMVSTSNVTVTLTTSNSFGIAVTNISVSCVPISILVGSTSQCTATVSGTGAFDPSVKWTTNLGSVNSSGLYTASAGKGTATVTATSVGDPTKSGSTNVAVFAAPACTFTANPLTPIIPPAQATLTWSCTNTSSCNLSGGSLNQSVNKDGGNKSVAPTQNTTYVLTCQGNGSGSGNTVSYQKTVQVQGTGVIEINP